MKTGLFEVHHGDNCGEVSRDLNELIGDLGEALSITGRV